MTAQVLTLPAKQVREVGLTYAQLRTFLHQRGHEVSIRWLKQRRAEGMPFFDDVAGRRRFLPSQAIPWLEAWAAERGRDFG